MYCPSCGKQNPDDAKFCESCGTSTGAGQPKAAPPPPPSPPPPPPPQQSYAPPPTPPPPPQQNYYQQPPSYQATPAAGNTAPMSIGQYLGTFLLMYIPFVGFILLLVWTFGSDVNQNKKNLCRAMLILMAIGIALAIVFGGILGGLIASLINSGYYY